MSRAETTAARVTAGCMRSYMGSRWAALPVLMSATFMIVMDCTMASCT